MISPEYDAKDVQKVKQQIDDASSSVLNPLLYWHRFTESLTALNDHNDPAIAALLKELKGHDGRRARESVAASVFAEFVPTAPIFSKVLAHVLNFYLDGDRKAERDAIVSLYDHGCQDKKILPYIYEALREYAGPVLVEQYSSTMQVLIPPSRR